MQTVHIRSSDYFLIRFCENAQTLLRWVADWETRFLRTELAAFSIDRPVFITGLARSGTTLLLELLAAVDGMATHRYRDFPFIMTPYLWNRYLDFFPVRQSPVERAHRDRIQVTRESSEALEEPLWRAFFPDVHAATSVHRLHATNDNPAFERFYQAHLRKMLLVRGGRRYLAKNNYHVPRMEYLARLFPDARFLVPIRHPLTHIHSLVRQHQLFSNYAAADARVSRCLAAAGHFEFGPQRMPIRLNAEQGDRVLAAWASGDEYLGYGIQWSAIYGFVAELRRTKREVARRTIVVRYEDLCAQPEPTMRHLLQTLELDQHDATRLFVQLSKVEQSGHTPTLDDSLYRSIHTEVGDVAAEYGYRLDTAGSCI
jgi:hypothetical protein